MFRGTFISVADLIDAISIYIQAWNERCEPFTWTNSADEVLAKTTPPKNRKTKTEEDLRATLDTLEVLRRELARRDLLEIDLPR